MAATPPDWRVAVKKGDIDRGARRPTTSEQASWYESMGIMPSAMPTARAAGADPFTTNVGAMTGVLTHGQLPENDNHGGGETSAYPTRGSCPTARAAASVDIKDFIYSSGDLTSRGAAGRPPVVQRGPGADVPQPDAPRSASSTRSPRAAPVQQRHAASPTRWPTARSTFDSGELGYGPAGSARRRPKRDTWQTPTNLKAGTYTYFCRIHPFMRGAFRVKG